MKSKLSEREDHGIREKINVFDAVLPVKRVGEFSEAAEKRGKILPVSYEEWAPYGEALKRIDFNGGKEGASEVEIMERRELAVKISTPEGLFEVINELEGRLAMFDDVPVDPEFDRLSVVDKIDRLFQEFVDIKVNENCYSTPLS